MPLMEMDQTAEEAKEDTLERVGDLSNVRKLAGDLVLVGVYVRPNVTKSGLHLPDEIRKEDEYQSKVGLVLKKGAGAFVSDSNYDFRGFDAEVGDWVSYRTSDGWPVVINGREGVCRVVRDVDIKMVVERPDMVF